MVLVGATATGKSALALDLAGRHGADGLAAEVVNADSMLVYRGMDIGTAKPTPDQLRQVRHHLIDIVDVAHPATVADFQRLARAAIDDCRTRGVTPLVVGGSALYVRAIVDDFEFPGTDPTVRARLESELAAGGAPALYARLRELDPESADRIEPGNARRVVRALEVIELTGRPYRAALPPRRYRLPDVIQIGLDIDRPTLDARIERRVEAMWSAGLVAEVEALIRAGLPDAATASRALGYRQVIDFLRGAISEHQAQAETMTATRKFARRQDSWFRRDPRVHWLPYDAPDLTERAYALVQGASPERMGD